MEILSQITFIGGIIALIILGVTFEKNRANGKHRRNKILLCIIGICLIGNIVLPETQYFIKFDSPEKAYRYSYFEKESIVLEGKESARVIGKSGSLIIEKVENKWRIPYQTVTIEVSLKVVDETTIWVDKYKNTDDYYITVSNFNGISPDICDNYKSHFYKRKENYFGVNENLDMYYAYVNKMDNEYAIAVNGETIIVMK